MNKIVLIRIKKIIVTISVLVASYLIVERTMSVKGWHGNTALYDFYHQPKNSIDVLLMGNSHSGINIDTSEFWKRKGISMYTLWGPSQPFDVTYFYLKEAVKYQRPKLIILDVYAAAYVKPLNRTENNGDLFGNIEQIRITENRVRSVITSVDKGKMNYFFGLPITHTRYDKLIASDFSHYSWNKENISHKGVVYEYRVSDDPDFSWGDPEGITEIAELEPFQEEYLLRIIEFCEDAEIPLMLVKSATEKRDVRQPIYNRVAQIASERNVPFVNYNLMDKETGLLPSDYYRSGHVNVHGSRKIGRHLADYIATHYDLPDHRGDPRYASWDAFVKNTQTEWLQNEWELSEWFSLVKNSGESVLLAKNGNKEVPELLSMLPETLGIPLDEFENKDYAVWVSENPKEQLFTDRYAGGLSLETFINSEKFYFDFYDGLKFVYKDQGIEMIEDPDWLAVVYDQESGKTMDVITVNSETGEFAHLPAEMNPSGL